MQIKKTLLYILEVLIIIFLIILIIPFLSLNIIDWPYPDEIFQYSTVKNKGLFATIFANWCCVSLGRPSAVAWIDFWMWLFQLININSIYTFVIYRIITFFTMFLSLFYLVKFFFNFLKNTQIFILSLSFYLIFVKSVGSQEILQTYGLDLSLYGIPLFYTVFLIIFGLRIHNSFLINKKNLFLYYFFLLLYLNSSYAHLVTGGLFIYFVSYRKKEFFLHLSNPLKYLRLIFFNNFLKKNYIFFVNKKFIDQNNIFAFAFTLFLFSSILSLLSPSLVIREKIWPTDTSLLLGLLNSLPVLEGLILYGWGHLYLLIILVAGCLSYSNNTNIDKYSIILRVTIISMAPIIVILTNGLAFTSTTLQGTGISNFDIKNWEQSLIIFSNLFKEFKYTYAVSSRHFFYFNHLIIISYFCLGLEIGNYIKKKLKNISL